jgi:hypothetical protein
VLARPRLQPLLERRIPVRGGGAEADRLNGDWIVDSGVYDAAGNHLASGGMQFCPQNPKPPAGGSVDSSCQPGSYNLLHYQPASRFWNFQLIETGLFLVLAAVLLVLAVHRVRRRIA